MDDRAQVGQQGTSSHTSSFSTQRHEIARDNSFRNEPSSSLSIVFNASWVKIATPIGEGAFSRVYEGVYTNPDTLEESVVAVKILKKNMLKRRSDCLRFIKEAKIMTKINHRNIVACYGIGKYDDDDEHNPGSLFIVQELVRGGNLLHKVYKQMLNRQKCVYTSQEALNWLMDVAEGMLYLHTITDNKPMIIHRDLKLENIMLMPDLGGTVAKLVDFGLHKVIDDRIKRVVKRVMSEANMRGGLQRYRAAADEVEVEEEEDELESALAQQREQQEAAAAAAGTAGSGFGSGPSSGGLGSPQAALVAAGVGAGASRFSPLRQSALEVHSEEDHEGTDDDGPSHSVQPSSSHLNGISTSSRNTSFSSKSPLSRTAVPEDAPLVVEANEQLEPKARLRAPPKKQNSMQKLMAKMKEIKLRVTGKLDSTPSKLSQSSQVLDSAAAVAAANAAAANPELSTADKERAQKIAHNHALLDRLIAQQSTAAAEKQQAMDDLGIIPSGAQAEKRRAPPRRAITWVNEVRYNLTEAVGSWAYMAPEVVLGQPYNEKVDVFSFGVILFEVLNRKLMLVDEIKNDPRKDAQAYAERVARGFRPEIPRRWPEPLKELISSAWAQDPHMRPNFTAVVDMMRELRDSGCVGKLDTFYWSKGSAYV